MSFFSIQTHVKSLYHDSKTNVVENFDFQENIVGKYSVLRNDLEIL